MRVCQQDVIVGAENIEANPMQVTLAPAIVASHCVALGDLLELFSVPSHRDVLWSLLGSIAGSLDLTEENIDVVAFLEAHQIERTIGIDGVGGAVCSLVLPPLQII